MKKFLLLFSFLLPFILRAQQPQNLGGPNTTISIPGFLSVVKGLSFSPNAYPLPIQGGVFIGDTVRALRDIIITLGDSYTNPGSLASPTSLGYAWLISGYMGAGILNLGATGSTSTTALTNQLPLVPAYTQNVRFVTVLLGANDLTANTPGNATPFAANIKTICDTLIARGYPLSKIIVLGVCFRSFTLQATTIAYNNAEKAMAAGEGVTYIDQYTYMINNGGAALVASDSLHPNTRGHDSLAVNILRTLNYRSGNLFVGGNIGVNNLWPQASIDVLGNIKVSASSTIDSVTIGRGFSKDTLSTALGRQSLIKTTSGLSNTGVGNSALNAVTSGSNNIGIGDHALYVDSTGARSIGIGTSVLFNNNGSDNSAFGNQAMLHNTSGTGNLAMGSGALLANTTGLANTILGAFAYVTGSGSNNVVIGNTAMSSATSSSNTVAGTNAMQNTSTGPNNTAFGYFSMVFNTSGSTNTALGYETGYNSGNANNRSITDNQMTFLGAQACRDSSTLNSVALSNATAIGYNSRVYANNQVALGNDQVTTTVLRGRTMINRKNSLTDNGKMLQDSGTAWINDTLTLPNIISKTGTTLSFSPALVDGSGNLFKGSFNDLSQIRYSHTIFTPATGNTITAVNNQENIINPAGTIATLTIALPASPANNDVINFTVTQVISAITYSGGTVVGGLLATSAGQQWHLTFDSGTTTWY